MTEDQPQPWDGGPDRVLPAGAITDHLDFLEALVDEELPGSAGDYIADALKNGAIMGLAAGEIAHDTDSERGMVVLWLPFFEDQRMYVTEGETVQHKEIPPLQRWRDTETAIGALSLGLPTRRSNWASSPTSESPCCLGLSSAATTSSHRNTSRPTGNRTLPKAPPQ